MTNFHYVCILQSLSSPHQIYTGITANLKQRLAEHNSARSSAHLKIHSVGDSNRHGVQEQRACSGIRALPQERLRSSVSPSSSLTACAATGKKPRTGHSQ
jgi:hypothetical protein